MLKITEKHKELARRALSALEGTRADRQGADDLIISAVGRKFFEFALSVSSSERRSQSTWLSIVNGRVCLHCKERLVDQAGGCKSVCGFCKESGVSGKEYKYEMYKQTNMENYGVENLFQAEHVKKKMAKTNLERYGDRNPAGKNSVLRPAMDQYLIDSGYSRSAKLKETMLEKHGVSHWTHSSDLVKKFHNSMAYKHGEGVTNVMHVAKHRKHHERVMKKLVADGVFAEAYKKCSAKTLELYGVDNIFKDVEFMKEKRRAKTGYEYPLQDPKARENFVKTSIERHGSSHHMHNPAIFEKTMRAIRTINLYECLFRDRHDFRVIGTYEIFVLSYLLTKYKPRNIKSGFEVPPIKIDLNRKVYYPDFYLKNEDVYVECKSPYTLLGQKKFGYEALTGNRFKARRAHEMGLKLIWVVPNPAKGTMLQLPEKWYELTSRQIVKLLKDPGPETVQSPPDQLVCRLLHRVP
jgi:hypothetical protein